MCEGLRRVMAMAERLQKYQFEHPFVDEASRDGTVEGSAKWPLRTPTSKLSLNARNFGPDRSGMNTFLQAEGCYRQRGRRSSGSVGAVCRDDQRMGKGFSIVAAVKNSSDVSGLMYRILLSAFGCSPALRTYQLDKQNGLHLSSLPG